MSVSGVSLERVRVTSSEFDAATESVRLSTVSLVQQERLGRTEESG